MDAERLGGKKTIVDFLVKLIWHSKEIKVEANKITVIKARGLSG